MSSRRSRRRPTRIPTVRWASWTSAAAKAYLTFALYHYLHTVRGLDITLVGVDVKADVLAQCAALAAEIGYTGLHFGHGRHTKLRAGAKETLCDDAGYADDAGCGGCAARLRHGHG